MIDPKLLRNNIEVVNAALAKRGVQLDVQEWASLETRRKDLQSKLKSYRQSEMPVLNKWVRLKIRW